MNLPLGAIVLAAGHSRRMASGFKLWRLVSGRPMVVHTIENVVKAGISPVVVIVKPADAPRIKNLAHPEAQVVINDRHESGMHSSIQTGVANLKRHFPDLAGFMICLADQPLLSVSDYQLLMTTFTRSGGKHIVCPQFLGERGNPVMIPAKYANEILSREGGDRGCFYLLQGHPDRVLLLDMPTDSVLFDVDTDRDFDNLTTRLSNALEARDDS